MGEAVVWERCRDAARELGSGVVWVEAKRIAEALEARPERPRVPEDEVRRSLDEHAVPLGRGPGFPVFVSDGTGRYALLESLTPAKGDGTSEARIRDILAKCLSRLGPAIGTSLTLLGTEYKVDGKSIDIAAEGSHRAFWALEVKTETETGDGVNQVAGYMSLAKRGNLGYASYWGAVLAPGFSDEAKAIARDRGIRLCQYQLCAEYTLLPLR